MGGSDGFLLKPAGDDVTRAWKDTFFEAGGDGSLLGPDALGKGQECNQVPKDQLI